MSNMNSCPHFDSRISAYHDGELPEEQRRRLSRHVARCERCRTELDRLRRIGRRVREHVEPSRLADDRVDAICSLNIPRNRLIVRTVRAWALAAAVVILAGVTWRLASAPVSPVAPANWERMAVLHEASTGTGSGVDVELQLAMLMLDETFDGEEIGHN